MGKGVVVQCWDVASTPQLVLTCRIVLLQVLPDLSAIIHQRDTLEVENDRLRTFLGLAAD
jgi:hypothetical protein